LGDAFPHVPDKLLRLIVQVPDAREFDEPDARPVAPLRQDDHVGVQAEQFAQRLPRRAVGFQDAKGERPVGQLAGETLLDGLAGELFDAVAGGAALAAVEVVHHQPLISRGRRGCGRADEPVTEHSGAEAGKAQQHDRQDFAEDFHVATERRVSLAGTPGSAPTAPEAACRQASFDSPTNKA
jgi:hypothetical protein